MTVRRPPNAFFLLLVLTILQPGLFVLVGAVHDLNTRGIGFVIVLLVALANGSRLAWVLLVVTNGVPLLAVVSLSGGAVAAGGRLMWSHAVVMVLTGVGLEAVLLSKPIRQYIGSRRPRTGSAIPSH